MPQGPELLIVSVILAVIVGALWLIIRSAVRSGVKKAKES